MKTEFSRAKRHKSRCAFASSAIFAVICILSGASKASAQGSAANANASSQESERAAQVRALNNSVLQLHGQLQENASGAAGVRGQAATVLAQRAAALQTLIQEDPHAALTFAFSPDLLADLAAKFPDSVTQLESHVTLSGPVEHWVMDSADMKTSQESWSIKTQGRRLSLYFATVQRPTANAIVTVEGVQVGSQVAVAKVTSASLSGAFSTLPQLPNLLARTPLLVLTLLLVGMILFASRKTVLRGRRRPTSVSLRHLAAFGIALLLAVSNPLPASAQNACSTTGVQQVAVLIVTFPGIAVPTFSPSLYDQFFGPASSLTSYWQEASYGATSATGNVFGPFTLSGTYSCSNIRQFMDDSIAAAAVSGVDFNTYNRVSIVFPDMNPSCGWAGISGIGCVSETTSDGTFNVSVSALPWTKLTPAVIFHENGHELGLAHARLRTFGTDVLGPLGATGTLTEYGDHYSAMGVADQGHYAAGHKAEMLGWLSSGITYQNVTTSGTYTLVPYEANTSGLHALKIQRGTGNPGYYLWVEYRQPLLNYDSTLAYAAAPNGNVFSGAVIHYEDSVTSIQTDLLDFTIPDTYADYPALVPGQSWTDPYSDLSLSVISATTTGLTVAAKYSGNVPCTSSAPTVSASPLNPSIYPGQSASYSVTVANNDSSACSPNTINLASTEPSGWSTSFSASSVTLSPGQSASLTMSKGASSGTPAGTYTVNLNASNNSATGTDTANVTVVTPPSVTVSLSVSGASFTRPNAVPITASVTSGGTPASGAGVTFTVTAPNGSAATQSATTSSNGTATWSYKLNQKSPVGTYSVTAQAWLSSGSRKAASTQSATSNTATFTVQ